ADVKRDMARVLTDGVGRGLNPLDIARNLTAQTGIEKRRANRIARTEVTTALRRAKWDEDQEANDLFGLKTLLVHISALSPTTRHTHAVRHAHLYTNEEVREWYAKDANSINCKCSQQSVLVDDDGRPQFPDTITKIKQEYKSMQARGYAWAEK
ncbi:phage head morphogenesis protein, partial [Salmonella enterica subsp. enterica serovar Montevideo]